MTTRIQKGGHAPLDGRLVFCALCLATLGGCLNQAPPPPPERVPHPELLSEIAAVQSGIRQLESQLSETRQTLTARREQQAANEESLDVRLGSLESRLASLPEELAGLCPEIPTAATVTTQCENAPNVQRVVVSGDKLVVGDVERVWLEPPEATVVASIDAGAESSLLHAHDILEFERDGNKWVRFAVRTGNEPATVERPVKRFQGSGSNRRPVVELRVQLGDVREKVEVIVTERANGEHEMTLGRNFLTDLALLEVGKRFVQPAFKPQNN